MINLDTACMCPYWYDNKEGHLPAHSGKPAFFPWIRIETNVASFPSRELEMFLDQL